jgi:hypothetical protein
LSRQEECDLAEHISGAKKVGHVVTVGQDIGVSLFDEVDGGSVVVLRDDSRARCELDLAHRGRELI